MTKSEIETVKHSTYSVIIKMRNETKVFTGVPLDEVQRINHTIKSADNDHAFLYLNRHFYDGSISHAHGVNIRISEIISIETSAEIKYKWIKTVKKK